MIDVNEYYQYLDHAEYGVEHAQSLGADEVEVYISSEYSQRGQIENDYTTLIQDVTDSGAFIRLVRDNRLGSAIISDVSRRGIFEAIEVALKSSGNGPHYSIGFPESKGIHGIHISVDKNLDELEAEDVSGFTERMINAVKETDPWVKVTDGLFSSTITASTIANSNGVAIVDVGSKVITGLRTKIGEGLGHGSGYDYRVEPTLAAVPPEAVGRASAELSVASVKQKRIEAGEYEVIFEPHAFADLVKALIMNAVIGKNLGKKASFLVGKRGSQVASSSISLYDDGYCRDGANRGLVDHEGTPTQKTPIIEKGVFKEALYDHASAVEASVASTGNGIRYFSPLYERLYRYTPLTEGTNLVLESGHASRDSLIEDTRDGLLVNFVIGSWAFNFNDGNYSADARNCFKVEDGEIVHAVDEATVSGNILDLMKDLLLADNPLQSRGYIPLTPATVITPSVKAEKVIVGA